MNDSAYNYDSGQIITGWVRTFNCSKCSNSIDASGSNAFASIKCPECGSAETVPVSFCNFLLLEVLSTNSTRSIYRARDESIGRPVIIKIMSAEFSADHEFIAEFRREARITARLNHDNIAQVYSFGVERRQPYIATEPINGEHLDKIIEASNGIPVSTAIRICYDIALGLQAAAKNGIVHENISPTNIILNNFGVPKITGFGLITVSHTVDQEKIVISPQYISPEQIRKQKVDIPSNIYNLGAVLYHMLVGSPPFADKNDMDIIIAHLEQCPVEVKKLRPETPDIVSGIVKRMLQPNPKERYTSYKALLSDIGKAISIRDDKDDQKDKTPGRKQITIRKNIKRTGRTLKVKTQKKTNNPSPLKTLHTATAPKRVIKNKRQEGNKNTVVNTHKYQLTKKSHSATKTPVRTQRKTLTAKNKELREQIRQKKRRKTKRITITLISIMMASAIAITVAYNRHQKTLARIEFFALKGAKNTSEKLFNQINENVSSVSNSVSIATNIQNDTECALLWIAGKSPVSQSSCATNAPDESAVNPAPESTDDNHIELPQNMNFDFEDEKLSEVTSKALTVETNINKLASIDTQVKTLRQNTEIIYLKALGINNSAKVEFQNIKLKKLKIQSAEYRSTSTDILEEIKRIHDEISEVSEEHSAEVERRRQAAIEAEKQRQEAIRLEQERLEYEALVKRELNQVRIDYIAMGTNSMLFASNDFKEIVNVLEEKFTEYRTPPGKKYAKVVIFRFKEIAQLKEEIIVCINKHTFPWGWGHNLAACDIIKADENGIYLRNKSHPWGSANVPQMLKFINYYIALPDVKFTTKANLALGGAVFCSEYGDKAKAKSEAFKAQAINYGVPRSKLNRLLNIRDSAEEQ